MELLAQTAWASGHPQFAWPASERDLEAEVPFLVAVPVVGANGSVLGLLLARGAEDSSPENPRAPRVWWLLRAVGEALSLSAGSSARDESRGTPGTTARVVGSSTGDAPGSAGRGGEPGADTPLLLGDPVTPSYAGLVGTSPVMQTLYHAIERVAPTGSTVLIQGESGTGKELVARAVHANSPRRDGPFVAISCPSIPRELIEAELFGHEKGAFTGANGKRLGQVQLASGGTLFLDEIGDIDIPTQTKLLRFLQEREFVPVGGQHPVRVDIRLVAATSRNLEDEVREGRLREDLYYRLSVVPLQLAPLRDRVTDVPALVRYFLDRMAAREDLARIPISAPALAALGRYSWPGNVRELRNVIEYLVAFHQGRALTVGDLPEKILGGWSGATFEGPATPDGASTAGGAAGAGACSGPVASGWLAGAGSPLRPGETLESRIMSVEGALIRETLQRCDGNQSKAARLLGLKESTMRNKMKRYGISGAAQRSSRRGSSRRKNRDGQES